jgi:hypothetical protein
MRWVFVASSVHPTAAICTAGIELALCRGGPAMCGHIVYMYVSYYPSLHTRFWYIRYIDHIIPYKESLLP